MSIVASSSPPGVSISITTASNRCSFTALSRRSIDQRVTWSIGPEMGRIATRSACRPLGTARGEL